MSYFSFLALFLGLPLLALGLLNLRDLRTGKDLPAVLQNWSPWGAVALHALVALLYTSPWDNYLVATEVWWYDPALVSGNLIAWVPVEEYAFFILQTALTGLWLLLLARRFQERGRRFAASPATRLVLAACAVLLWIAALSLLFGGAESANYLGLELGWALPPIAVQLAFGADILRHYRRLLLPAIGIPTLYLSLADTIAISAGTWTISPTQSTGLVIGPLPLEEVLFFLLTNTLIVFGMVLLLARQSRSRLRVGQSLLFRGGDRAARPKAAR